MVVRLSTQIEPQRVIDHVLIDPPAIAPVPTIQKRIRF